MVTVYFDLIDSLFQVTLYLCTSVLACTLTKKVHGNFRVPFHVICVKVSMYLLADVCIGALKFPCPFPERTFPSFSCINFPFVCRKHLRNGKRRACNHRVMDVSGRLLSTKEALSCSRCSREQLQLLECLNKPPKWIHNSMAAQLQRLPFLLQHNQGRKCFHLPSVESVFGIVQVDVCCHLPARKQNIPFITGL